MNHFTATLTTLCFLFSVSAQAETASTEQLLKFAKAVGIYEQIEEQKVAIQLQAGQAAEQYAQQIKASFPGAPDQFAKDFETEMAIYLSNVAELIDTDFAVETYIRLISQKLSAAEVQQLTEFHESDLGRKYTRSNTEITGEWTTLFLGDMDKKVITYLQDFTDNLVARISREHTDE